MICCPPSAGATPEETALNGMFSAVSDGAWAKTNESFRDEARVVATWTVSSSCTTYQDCTGTVSSDQGWTANLVFRSGKWTARHMVPRWIPCPDGTFSDAEQIFIFWPKRADAPDHRDLFIGWDTTLGPSGACGVNRNLEVRMPFTLTRIG
ncbi:hypothetical protein A5727_18250 [Mycobacterium sp. ACS4331]|nr:hypothetical protein A5727_18250 [Mycobacterium sp. ACS4331]